MQLQRNGAQTTAFDCGSLARVMHIPHGEYQSLLGVAGSNVSCESLSAKHADSWDVLWGSNEMVSLLACTPKKVANPVRFLQYRCHLSLSAW